MIFIVDLMNSNKTKFHNPIYTTDKGHKLEIINYDPKQEAELYCDFCLNETQGTVDHTEHFEMKEGNLIVKIPAEIMKTDATEDYHIFAFIRHSNYKQSHTLKSIQFKVIARPEHI